MKLLIVLAILLVIWLAAGVIVALVHIAAKAIILALIIVGAIALAKWIHHEASK